MNNEMAELRLLSKNNVAKILGIRNDKVNELIETGKIRFLSFKKRIKIPMSELKRFIEENLVTLQKEDLDSEDFFLEFESERENKDFDSVNYLKELLKEN